MLKANRVFSKRFLDDVKSILFAVLLAMSIRIFVMELFLVPTGSMKATILEGDYIFATKYSYGFSKHSLPFSLNLFDGRVLEQQPTRGDIVIMRPPHDMDTRFIKRLIGMPGEKIQIIDNVIYINDKPILRKEVGRYYSESGVMYIKFQEILPNGVQYFSYKLVRSNFFEDKESLYNNYGPIIVPVGQFFFLGDNRDESGDSRAQLGTVPFENFIAKARFIFISRHDIKSPSFGDVKSYLVAIIDWITAFRTERIFKNLYLVDKNTEV
jgi:signal peptidase I